jgi:hypothetical protein
MGLERDVELRVRIECGLARSLAPSPAALGFAVDHNDARLVEDLLRRGGAGLAAAAAEWRPRAAGLVEAMLADWLVAAGAFRVRQEPAAGSRLDAGETTCADEEADPLFVEDRGTPGAAAAAADAAEEEGWLGDVQQQEEEEDAFSVGRPDLPVPSSPTSWDAPGSPASPGPASGSRDEDPALELDADVLAMRLARAGVLFSPAPALSQDAALAVIFTLCDLGAVEALALFCRSRPCGDAAALVASKHPLAASVLALAVSGDLRAAATTGLRATPDSNLARLGALLLGAEGAGAPDLRAFPALAKACAPAPPVGRDAHDWACGFARLPPGEVLRRAFGDSVRCAREDAAHGEEGQGGRLGVGHYLLMKRPFSALCAHLEGAADADGGVRLARGAALQSFASDAGVARASAAFVRALGRAHEAGALLVDVAAAERVGAAGPFLELDSEAQALLGLKALGCVRRAAAPGLA